MTLRSKTLNILIIEDNTGDYVLIEEYLKEEVGTLNLTRTRTLSETKKFLEPPFYYDVILLDLSLPDAVGEDLVNQIIKISDHIPVIALTGYLDKHFGVKSLSLGISDYLLKDDISPPLLSKSISHSIERKRISIQLEQSEIKYRNLFHFSPIPMWVFETGTLRFLDVNNAAIRHYGYSKEEFLSMTIKDIRPKEDIPLLDEVKKQTNQGKDIYFQGEFRHQKKNGEVIIVEIRNNLVDFKGMEARLVLAIDITLNKKQELEKEHLIGELTQHISDIRQFAYITSHNLRAPLSNLIGLLDLTEDIPIENSELKEIIEGFKVSTNFLNNTVEDLIKILVIKDKKPVLQKEVRFEEIFQKVLIQTNNLIKEINPSIEYDFKEAPSIPFNHVYLESILLNLLTNAIKFRSPNRILQIKIKTKKLNSFIHLEFEDNGIGINLERHKDRLFGLYQRFHNHPESKGLGLFLVKSQLEAFGATIQMESKVDLGTKFLIQFKGKIENE